MDKHPGGSEVVHLMAGRDATDAFSSYHPFTDKPRKVTYDTATYQVHAYLAYLEGDHMHVRAWTAVSYLFGQSAVVAE